MSKTNIAIRLEKILISEIEKLFKSIIHPNNYKYTSEESKMYYYEDELIWITCELSKWDMLGNSLYYYTYFKISYNKNFKDSIPFIEMLIDIMKDQKITVYLECEEQDKNGNLLRDEFIIKDKKDLSAAPLAMDMQ